MRFRLLTAALLILAACDARAASSPTAAPDFRGSGLASCSAGVATGALADIALPCMDGSGDRSLGALSGRPTVVELWGSWCPPCGKELPVFQRLHEAAGDRVAVVGVVTEDSATASVGATKELRLAFPQLYDRSGRVRVALGRVGLPITVFLDARGAVVSVYNGAPLDDAALRALVSKYLGVRLP